MSLWQDICPNQSWEEGEYGDQTGDETGLRWTGLYDCWELNTLCWPCCNILPPTWTLLCGSFPAHPDKKQPCMSIALKKTKQSIVHPIFAAQLITGLLGWMMWKCHTINLFNRHRHLPSSLPICFAWKLAPHSTAFPLHCYYNSLYASLALIKLWFCLYTYSKHPS